MSINNQHVTIRQQDDGFVVAWYRDLSDPQASTIFAPTYRDALRYKDKFLGRVG
jgi:hypothetical protein